MTLDSIKQKFQTHNLFHSETPILKKPSVIAYEKKFRWAWMATQLNTFIVASDFGEETVGEAQIERHLEAAFRFAKANYTGWPRGLQSGLAVISVLIGNNISDEAKAYCTELKSGKKWAAVTVPVVVDTAENKVYSFRKKPMWGRIYYPHFEKLIKTLI